jgi:hypothetical protein
MKMPRTSHVILVWWLILSTAAPAWLLAQETAQQLGGAPLFKPEQLEQIVAPIAVYPDDLLAQIFMAATYPLEIVQAARWVKANPNLKGDQLAKALEQQTWDPSVESVDGKMIGGFALVAYPAQYGNSGIMTFIANQDGVIYPKNLGKDTANIVQAMDKFDPDNTWKKAQ